MDMMMWLYIGVLVVVVVIGGVVFFLRGKKSKKKFPRYDEKPVLSKNDAVLFGRLCRALPNCFVFPHVKLSSLIEPTDGNRKTVPEHFERIERLSVNFVVVDADLDLICVVIVEPENPTAQDPIKNAIMERCLKSATIKTLRWSASSKPSVEQIARAILPLTSAKVDMGGVENMMNPDTVQRIYKADPVPSNIKGLTPEQLDTLTPSKVLSSSYPHIWQRVCLFAPEPKHLQKYLLSLSIQDRGEKRAGFPIEALKEIADIQTENDRFLLNLPTNTSWQPSFVNR